jgi:hypothetical protein
LSLFLIKPLIYEITHLFWDQVNTYKHRRHNKVQCTAKNWENAWEHADCCSKRDQLVRH